jgi:hypothetical protein
LPTPIGAASALIPIVILVTLGYLAVCWLKPFRACHKCEGTGRIHHRIGRGSRTCHRCRGTGLRLRLGRHLINHYRRIHHAAHAPTTPPPPLGAGPRRWGR